MVRRTDIVLAILSGVILVFVFPPFDLYPLAWFALVPLLVSLYEKERRISFLLGTLTGFVYFIGTIYWVFIPMYYYGNVPLVISALLVVILCFYLGIYIGVFSVLFNYLNKYSRFPALFIVPTLWVALEFLRTYALTGFPWCVLGYSQYKFPALIQIADITGVYGVSFIVASLNGAIFDLIQWPKRLSKMPLFARWPMTVGLISLALIVISSLSYGIWRLKTHEQGQKIRVSVIQGNFEQDKKWDVKFRREIIDTYKRLTLKASEYSPYIIVWPESALPFIFGNDKVLTTELVEFQKKIGTYLLFGSVIVKDIKDNNEYELSNSAVLMSPSGEVVSVYDKMHLVPFGEYVPLKKIFPFINKLVVAIGDFTAGKEYTVMDAGPAKISTPICYEIIFPGMVRKFANKGANLFISITNDAWFGRTSAPYQHFSMGVLRAVENRMPVLRAANTGVSGIIDAKGRIKRKSDIFVEDVLIDEVILGSFNKSFYSRYGDLFAFLCIISCVLIIANNIYPKDRV